MTKEQLQAELDKMSLGKYSGYTIGSLSDRVAWMWKWRKITEEEKNSMAEQVIQILKSPKNYLYGYTE